MIIHQGYEGLDLVRPVVTLGIFDGVHRGHMELLGTLVSRARESAGEAVVITFFPHPRLVLDPHGKNMSFLTTMDEKISLLEKAKADHLVIVEFNREFSKIRACDFISEILYGKIGTRHLIIGYNHRFGSGAEGDFDTLVKCAENLDFRVEQVHGLEDENGPISSSSIRKALLSGKIEDANRALGYKYTVSGRVIEGRKLGRSLGFPTANIEPDNEYKLIPAIGVYAVRVRIEDKELPGMLSIGFNPTVSQGDKRSIEVHILDFSGNLYDASVSLIFYKRLRDEVKFRSKEDLAFQMALDKQQVVQLFS